MKYNPQIHHRHSIRLKGYDYSQEGLYFITLCLQNREDLFGEIKDGKMKLNQFGKIIEKEWLKTEEIRKNITLEDFIIMPNHFHAIIRINYSIKDKNTKSGKFQSPSNNIGAIIRGFKGATTKKINILRISTGVLQYAPTKSIWQRNYWEHIIRDQKAFDNISRYIKNNPKNWKTDKLNN